MLLSKATQTQQPFPPQSYQTCDELFITNEIGKQCKKQTEQGKEIKPGAVCQANKLHINGNNFWESEDGETGAKTPFMMEDRVDLLYICIFIH